MLLEKGNRSESIELLRKVSSGKVEFTNYTSEEFDVNITLLSLTAGSIQITVSGVNENSEEQLNPKEVLYVSASIKPLISLVWTGIVVMFFGFLISAFRRLPQSV
jgi:cytochrome c biogenesis factor